MSAAAPFTLCFCCASLVRQLQMPLVPLTAVTSFRAGDVMHRRLRGYKDAPVAEVRAACRQRLAAMLEGWLGRTGEPDAGAGRWDTVVTVPSSSRPAGAPLGAVISAVPSLARLHRPLLVRGPQPTGHLQAARRGFSLRPGTDADGLGALTVLVVDDSVVTGARAQSAAAALRLAGAEVVGVVVLGRFLAGAPAAG
jgi:adenine/guanine phosphoribosyltransferase-like PRPP-binding protein